MIKKVIPFAFKWIPVSSIRKSAQHMKRQMTWEIVLYLNTNVINIIQ